MQSSEIKASLFGNDFVFGVANAAFQVEGSWNEDGKGLSIWDKFTERKHKIKTKENAKVACDFYHRYESDIKLMQSLGIKNFRFSISWSRIIPFGKGIINQKGIDFYNRVIDCCIAHQIEPWVTLYHWDLPYSLELEGGWLNRDVVNYFTDYVDVCAKAFGDRVKHWMVLNEPLAFTFLGYLLGWHAPGKKDINKFVAAIHHATLAQAEGARALKNVNQSFEVGTTFSCLHITPNTNHDDDVAACKRADALLNRMFVEPTLGLGYPLDDLKFLHRIEKYVKPGDENKMQFDFDFIGIQNYSREVVKHAFYVPYLHARNVSASKRKVLHTEMNWEVYPEAIYHMIKKFDAYKGIKKIYVTENGAAFKDVVVNGEVHDVQRINYLQSYLEKVLRAKFEGAKVHGYFIWTFTDNFEWAEGFRPRFGIVYNDPEIQKRIPKLSAYWYKEFLGA